MRIDDFFTANPTDDLSRARTALVTAQADEAAALQSLEEKARERQLCEKLVALCEARTVEGAE